LDGDPADLGRSGRCLREGHGAGARALEVYLLWNKPGHFEGVGYRLEKVSKTYRERAQRFQNLYNNLGGGPVSRPDLVDAPNVTSTP